MIPTRTFARSAAGGRLGRTLLLVAGILFSGSTAALAQFNGPTTPGGEEINRPITITTDTSILNAAARDVVITFGDQLTLHLFGDPDYAPIVRVGADGNVLLPFLGVVHIEGLSVTQAEELIEEKLSAAGQYVNPQLIIQITEGPNAVVTIAGEVHGVIPVVGSRRLLDVLSAGGGLPPTASHVLTINRPGLLEPIVVDLGSDPLRSQLANIPVFPGDTIVVARLGIVYVFGSFKSAGTIPLNAYTPLTLTEATALSGGILFDGRFKDLRIIRTVGNHRTVATYDIKAVLNGKVPDPILQPNDIVYLPPVPFKTLLSSGGLGTIFGLTSLIISIARP